MNTLKRATLSAAVCLIGLAAGSRAQTVQVQINSPEQGAEVGRKATVRGTIADPKAQVFVLVRPVQDRYWWVQRVPHPSNQDGSWETLCYFGTADEGPGEEFQIIALVTRGLREEQRFEDLPPYIARSETVKVRRRGRERPESRAGWE